MKNTEEQKRPTIDLTQYLRPKDGKTHVLLTTVHNNISEQLPIHENYTRQLNNVVEELQEKGYEIIDIKISSRSFERNIGYAFFDTLIIYK